MMKLRLLLVMFVSVLLVTTVIAQDADDNGAWQTITIAEIQFRLPATWTQTGDTFSDNESNYRLAVRFCDADSPESEAASFGESIELPFGEAQRQQTRTNRERRVRFRAVNGERCVIFSGFAPLDSEIAVFDQIANTLMSTVGNDGWQRYADQNAVIFLRVPADWRRDSSTSRNLTVRTTFDEVLITIAYRDLEQAVTPDALRDQFLNIYENRGYTIEDVTEVNLPIGDAVRYDLSGVRVTSSSTHRQTHYVIMRDTIMLLATFGADERYHNEYAGLLEQIADTMQFQQPE